MLVGCGDDDAIEPVSCPIEVGPSECPSPGADYCACVEQACPTDPSFHLIWTAAKCTECHGPGDDGMGIPTFPDLQPSVARDNLVGVASEQSALVLVEPGDLVRSYLWHKLRRTHLCPAPAGSGEGMPTTSVLDADPMAEIEAWICCGAEL
jgi:hypothetical protein